MVATVKILASCFASSFELASTNAANVPLSSALGCLSCAGKLSQALSHAPVRDALKRVKQTSRSNSRGKTPADNLKVLLELQPELWTKDDISYVRDCANQLQSAAAQSNSEDDVLQSAASCLKHVSANMRAHFCARITKEIALLEELVLQHDREAFLFSKQKVRPRCLQTPCSARQLFGRQCIAQDARFYEFVAAHNCSVRASCMCCQSAHILPTLRAVQHSNTIV